MAGSLLVAMTAASFGAHTAGIAEAFAASLGVSLLILIPANLSIGLVITRALSRRLHSHQPLIFAAFGFALFFVLAIPISLYLFWEFVEGPVELVMVAVLCFLAGCYGAANGLGIGLYLRYPRAFR